MSQEKKLKLIISSFKQRDLLHFFQLYSQCFLPDIIHHTKKISYNCYEAQLTHHSQHFNGYGKNNNQAMASAIVNLMHKLLDQPQHHHNIKQCIRRYTLAGGSQARGDKAKTLPDAPSQKKIRAKGVENTLQPKEHPMKGTTKSIKEEIFESLNHHNIQLKSNGQGRNPSCEGSGAGQSELESVYEEIKVLEKKLAQAYEQNEYLKSQLQTRDRSESSSAAFRKVSSAAKLDCSFTHNNPTPSHNYPQQPATGLRDISNTHLNNTQHPNPNPKQPTPAPNSKIRSYSLSNSVQTSNYNSRNQGGKVKIPKLNLEILPNYHGKSNKSLNQSLLDNYEKKTKMH